MSHFCRQPQRTLGRVPQGLLSRLAWRGTVAEERSDVLYYTWTIQCIYGTESPALPVT
jgi:hypothetical protein